MVYKKEEECEDKCEKDGENDGEAERQKERQKARQKDGQPERKAEGEAGDLQLCVHFWYRGSSHSVSVFQDGETRRTGVNSSTLSSSPDLSWYSQHTGGEPPWILRADQTLLRGGNVFDALAHKNGAVPLQMANLGLQDGAFCALRPRGSQSSAGQGGRDGHGHPLGKKLQSKIFQRVLDRRTWNVEEKP